MLCGVIGSGNSRVTSENKRKRRWVGSQLHITIFAALNLPYATWPDFLANPALTKALLSRLRERCHTITIDGPCIRPQTG